MLLSVWRRLPFQAERPGPTPPPATEDRFALSVGRPGRLEGPSAEGPWNAYYLGFTPQARVRAKGGRIVFTEIRGSAELWLDGKKVAEKSDPAPAPMTAAIPAAPGERTLSLIVRAEPGKPSGMAKLAVIRES